MVQIQEVAQEKKLDKTTPDVCSIDVINDKTLNFQINYNNLLNQESKEVKDEIKQIKELKEEEKKIDNSIKYDKLWVSPTKTVLNTDPMIYTIENFLSDEECDHIINISKDKLQQSIVSGEKEGFVSEGRSGKNTWIEHNFDNITKKIAENISKLVGLPLENAEQYQVIYYEKEQQYKQHYDGWLFDNSEKSKRSMKKGGQRMITTLVYLNTVSKGGGTKFTKLNKHVISEKGKLLVFYNVMDGTNKRHELSEHAGMPVIEGEKWAFNLWFREQNRNIEYNYPLVDSYTLETPVLEESEEKIKIDNSVLTEEDMITILKLSKFEDKERSTIWIKNNEIPDIISKLSDLVNISSDYFENMRVTKYKKGEIHRDHYDAYDMMTERGKEYTKTLGQRLLTITGFLSSTSIKFSKLNKQYNCNLGTLIYYKNCLDYTNNRNPNLIKSYQKIQNEEDGIDEMILFNIFVREKSTSILKI